jgi:hypothetical protein
MALLGATPASGQQRPASTSVDSMISRTEAVLVKSPQAVQDSSAAARKQRRGRLKKQLLFGLTGVVLVTSALLFYNVRSK